VTDVFTCTYTVCIPLLSLTFWNLRVQVGEPYGVKWRTVCGAMLAFENAPECRKPSSFFHLDVRIFIGSYEQPMICSKKSLLCQLFLFISNIHNVHSRVQTEPHFFFARNNLFSLLFSNYVHFSNSLYHISCCNFFTQFFLFTVNRFFIHCCSVFFITINALDVIYVFEAGLN